MDQFPVFANMGLSDGVVAYGTFSGSAAEDKIHILYKSYYF